MCTAISFLAGNHYFGRNLDLEYGYAERIAVTPRNFPFLFRHMPPLPTHYAMIGMATIIDGYPLYYEATNEHGLSIAGLNFPGLAHYEETCAAHKHNVASFELIPWLLAQCENVTQAKTLLNNTCILRTAFHTDLPATPLHWMLCDKDACVTVEAVKDGLRLYDNPVGVLTNCPDFPYHMTHLEDYQNLSPLPPANRFAADTDLPQYSGAMGAIGLPGDWSSASRFIRAAFVKLNAPSHDTEAQNINQFFRILQSVAMPMGSVQVKPGLYDITRYSCCCTDSGRYYYTTYTNSRVTCVDMQMEDLNGNSVVSYPLLSTPDFLTQNQR